MHVAFEPGVVDADQLERLPDGDHYELVAGHLVEKDMGAKADAIALRVGSVLDQFCLRTRLGRAFGSATGYRCYPDDPNKVRLPDASFVAAGRLPDDRPPDGYIRIAPDLAVEAVSPNEYADDVEVKVTEYLAAGVRLVWVVFPAARTVHVRRADGTAAVLTEAGELSGESVVPGFACKVADLFA